ncbi:hypothetical protein [Spirosoma jeollabukense]
MPNKDGTGYIDGFLMVGSSSVKTDLITGAMAPYIITYPPSSSQNLNNYYNYYSMDYLNDPSIPPIKRMYYLGDINNGFYKFFVICKKSDGTYTKSKTITFSQPFYFFIGCGIKPTNFTANF